VTPEPTPPYALPEYLTNSKLLKKRRVKKHQLPSYTEAMALLHAPTAQAVAWKTLIEKAEAGNLDAVKVILDIFKLIPKGGGMTIVQQTYASTGAVSVEGRQIKNADAFIRSIHEQRASALLSAPAEDPNQAALSRIIDAETVDA
jgi:hypothetical protein